MFHNCTVFITMVANSFITTLYCVRFLKFFKITVMKIEMRTIKLVSSIIPNPEITCSYIYLFNKHRSVFQLNHLKTELKLEMMFATKMPSLNF